MIGSFFQHLERARVDYLLISGQATILYGAALFSEDVDLWLAPNASNLETFVGVLRAHHARYYKLTPPLQLPHLAKGHGFHFIIPSQDSPPEVYLDVMGHPPRVGSFESAVANARWFDTDWGRVHTVGIRDLVELKKTQRTEDYPIISRLALAYLEDPAIAGSEDDLRWALDNIFSIGELRTFLSKHATQATWLSPPVEHTARLLARTGELSDEIEEELDDWIEQRVSVLRKSDRRYWRAIIEELRQLRAAGQLMPEGELV